MDDTQLLDCTQAIPCDLDDDEEEEEAHRLVAWLEVNGNRHEIFSGRNIIGRDPDKCKVFIPSKVLSKEHAVVEVRAGTHTLADLDSSNKTRLGKMTLRPHVQYALQGGEKIRFGNVAAIYTIKPEMCDDDSGSETCSESLLPMMGEEEEEERSSSPIFAPRLDYQVPQDAQQGAVENGIEVPPASAKSSHTPQSEGAPPSASPGTSLLQTSVSFLQPSDAESSVISATQSPSRRNFTSLSPNCTPKSLQEDYDSDRSTDVEDNTTHEPSLPAPQCETPTDSASCTFIPETPAQPSFDSLISKTPEYYSTPNRSIQETSTGPSPLSLKRENISLPPSQITSISETPSNSSLADTVVKTLGMTQKDDMSTKSHNDEDVFKKPLTTFTPKTCRTPTDHFSPKSSLVSKAKEAVPVHLFSTKDSHPVDPDAPRQVSTRDVPSDDDHDALTQVFTGEVDLDAPTQVFTHDTSVDLDAPTQVFTNDVDLDAPTQVFTHDTGVDPDAPTQVFTSGVDFNAHKQVCTSDIDLDAPTQVFTSEAPSNVDLDAPTQLFTNDIPSDADPDAPTQVFTSDAASNVDPDAPTQVFTSDAASNVDPDAPTQVFTSDAASNVDPDAPTQVFTSEPASNVDPDVPTQVFTSEPASNVDPDVPTQVFTSEPASIVDPDVPTQVFTSDAPSDTEIDAPTQVFTSEPASNADPDAPTQVFTSDAPSDTDVDAPTQVFSYKASGYVKDKLQSETCPLSADSVSNTDDPPSSPIILSDMDDADIPSTQPYSDLCADAPRPSSSIIEAWGHLESTACLSTNKISLADPGEGKCHENDAASDASESLFNEEDEADSIHGKDMGNDHKLREENYHSDDSSELEDTPTEAVVLRSRKTGGKAAPSQSLQTKDPAGDGHLKTPFKQKRRKSGLLSESESEEGSCNLSLRLFDLPSDTEFQERITSTKLSSRGSKESSEDILVVTPHKEKAESVETQVSEQTTSKSSSQDSKESSKDILAITPHKERAKHHEGMSDDESEENVTRRTSARLCSPRGIPSQNRRGRRVSRSTAAVSVSSPSASVSSPHTTLISAQACNPSITPTSHSPLKPLSPTTTSNTSTLTSTPTPTHTQDSLPCIAPVPNTRRPGRKIKSVRETTSTSTPVTDSAIVSIRTRRYGKRSINKDDPASTTNNNKKCSTAEVITTVSITTAKSTTTVIPATAMATATATTTSITADTTSSPTHKRKTRQRTQPQRVTSQSKLDVKDPEAESVVADSAQPQPSIAAITDTSITLPTTRRRRGRPSTKPPVMKIKVEVPSEDEPIQMTTPITIKQEKEEVEALACPQIPIKEEPDDDFSEEESNRSRRTRRKPARYSPERLNLRSKKGLPSSEPMERVLRENTQGAGTSKTRGGKRGSCNAPGQQRRSQRVQLTTQPEEQEEVGIPVGTLKKLTLKVKVKEEPEVSEEEPSESLAPLCLALPETDAPPKKSSRSRPSTSRSAQQAPSISTKKIKLEVIPKEESDDDIPGVSESGIIESRAKKPSASYSKRKSNQNMSSGLRAKRSSSDVSDVGSLSSNNSFSSRATRSNKDVELWSPSKRQRQASSKPRVLFTGYHDPADHKIVTDLGGKVVETPLDCTVLVTTKLKRTCKLLSAIGRGRTIVSPNWLTMSKTAGNFVDPWQFLLKDPEAEEKYGFCLEATIRSACNFLLFEGLSLHATPSVQPPPCQMRDIIECAGGDYLHAAPKKYEPQIRIISCPEDRKLWPAFTSLGIPILGVEFILTGLLRHELLLDEFVLE